MKFSAGFDVRCTLECAVHVFVLVLLAGVFSGSHTVQAQQVTCGAVRQCRVMRLLAYRYYLPDQTVSASLTLTGSSSGVASLDGVPLTFTVPQFLNVTATILGSSANSGDSGYSSTLTFTPVGSGASITCTYTGIGTGFPPYDPAQANAYAFSGCSDGGSGTSPGTEVTAIALTVRVVSGGEQNSPNDPTAVGMNITEASTSDYPCQPPSHDPTAWINIGGNRRLGGEVWVATGDDGVTQPSPVTVCSTASASATIPPVPTSSVASAPVSTPTVSTASPDGWTSPLGSLAQTIAVVSVAALAIITLVVLTVCLRRRRCKCFACYGGADNTLPVHVEKAKQQSEPDDKTQQSSGWSIDASRETMADGFNAVNQQDFDNVYESGPLQYVHNGYQMRVPGDGTESEFVSSDSLEPQSYTPNVRYMRNSYNTDAQQYPDRTLMNTKAEIALPGFLKLDYHNDLRPDVVIAEGGGGIVYQAELLDDRLRQKHGVGRVVVKLVKNAGGWTHEELLDHFRQEVSIMWSLNFHDHVIKLVGYSEEPMSIVTRLYSRSLLDLIQDPNLATFLGTDTVYRFTYHICSAMGEIHSLGIAHRDLKAANLLIELPPSPTVPLPPDTTPPAVDTTYWKIIVCDFGLAKVLGEAEVKASKFSDVQGISVRYAAPEVFARMHIHMLGAPRPKSKVTTSADGTAECVESVSVKAAIIEAPAANVEQLPAEAMLQPPAPADSSNSLMRLKDAANDDKLADIYAFSIIIWEMATHDVCWKGLKNDEIEWNVRSGKRPPVPVKSEELVDTNDADAASNLEHQMTETLLRIMQDCWQQEPAKRPAFEDTVDEMSSLFEQLPKPDMSLFEPPRSQLRSSMNSIAMNNMSRSRLSMQPSLRQSMRVASTARSSAYFHGGAGDANSRTNRTSMQGSAFGNQAVGNHYRASTTGNQHIANWNGARRSRHVTSSGVAYTNEDSSKSVK